MFQAHGFTGSAKKLHVCLPLIFVLYVPVYLVPVLPLVTFALTGLIVESAQARVGREVFALKPRESYDMALQVKICGEKIITLETFLTTALQGES